MGRKKQSKSCADSSEKERLTVAKVLFADVLQGSINTTVDPRACIPLTRIRSVSKSGVLRLKKIFRGSVPSSKGENVGFVAGSDMPIVVPLEGALSRFITDYFREEMGMSDSEAREESRSRSVWYGVVDGMHRLLALLELVREAPDSWDGFLWPVLLLKGGQSLQVLRQLARQQNRKLSEQNYVETTLYDQLSGLKVEADRLERVSGKRPTAREVATEYDGSSSLMDTTIQQIAATAMRLSDTVIETLGSVMNAEHPELVEIVNHKKSGAQDDDVDIMSAADCRVFRRYLNITSIKQATAFMKAEGDHGEQAQVNTLLRCRDLSRASGYKSIPHRVVTEQFQKATLAIKECQKFERLLESDKWPVDMETTRKNILETTKCDEEISRNAGNDNDILKTLIDRYKIVCPAMAAVKIQKHSALHINPIVLNADDSGNAEEPDVEGQPGASDKVDSEFAAEVPPPCKEDTRPDDIEELSDGHHIPNDHTKHSPSPAVHRKTNSPEPSEDDPVVTTQLAAISVAQTQASERLETLGGDNEGCVLLLKSLYIECHQMRWQEFDRNILSEDDPSFDLILTDPPYGIGPNPAKAGTKYKNYVDDLEMREFGQFCRRALTPGGYVFLFTSAKYFNSWSDALRGSSFKVCQYPFVLSKNTTGLQGIRLEDFPQCATEFAVMARAPGKSALSFKPDFRSPFHLFECPQKRRFASVVNAPVPRKKLTDGMSRAPILTEEKNPDVLAEIMTTFCPDGGRVLDCYAGTCTTAIACLMTGRRCVCIEMNPDIFRSAFGRLLKLAPTYKSNPRKQPVTMSPVNDAGHDTRHANAKMKLNGNSSTESSADESSSRRSRCIKGGDVVALLLNGEEVGHATVQALNGDAGGQLTRSIHGTSLEKFQKKGEDLVSILRVAIVFGCYKKPYIYSFPTQDDIPLTLGDLHPNGVYVWDCNQMSLT